MRATKTATPSLSERRSTTPSPEASTAIVNRLFNFKPEGFEDSWNHIFATFEPEKERNVFLKQIAIRMAGMGHPDDAIAVIQAHFGEGQIRAELIAACFSYSADLTALANCYQLLEFEGEMQSAGRAIAACLAMKMSERGGNLDPGAFDLSYLGDGASDTRVLAAQQYLLQVEKSRTSSIDIAFQNIMNMGFPDNEKGALLDRLATRAPFLSWREFITLQPSGQTSDGREIIQQMIAKDASRTIRAIVDERGFEKQLGFAIRMWGKRDAKQPTDWLVENRKNLTPHQSDNATWGIAVLCAERGDIESARKWGASIADQAIKTQLETAVQKQEHIVISKAVQEAPEKLIHELIDSDPRFGLPSLETAFTEWVNADADSAAHWYEANAGRLTADQQQYVAAAYAREAASQGDMDLAQRWSALIQDERLSARVFGVITQAGSTKKVQGTSPGSAP